MSLKALLKSVLPAPILSYASACKQKFNLANTADNPFPATNLIARSRVDLISILTSAEIAATWATDRQAVEKYHPANDLYGGVNPGDRRALYNLVRAFKPQNMLEVGTHIGSSTLHIALALNTNGQGHLDTVDIYDVNDPVTGAWVKVKSPHSPAQTLETLGLQDRVSFHTSGALTFFGQTQKKYDMIFLDGDHSATTVYNEVSAALSLLSPNGMIVLHDYYPGARPMFLADQVIHGPYLAMERIQSECPEITVVPLGELPWPTKKGSHMTSLALVTKAT